jgi:hypothetical protein
MLLASASKSCLRVSKRAAAIENVNPMRSPASASSAVCQVAARDRSISSSCARWPDQ